MDICCLSVQNQILQECGADARTTHLTATRASALSVPPYTLHARYPPPPARKVYGLATLVYQYGILDFTTFYGFKSTDGLCWIPFVLAFAVLVGLGLDYHIFLLSRVVEFRKQGFSDRESVLLGLARTGRVITAAGIIMAIAFLGLLFGHEPLLQQVSSRNEALCAHLQ